MTHEEILTTLGNYVDYLIAGSSAEAPLWNIEKVRSGKPNKWNYVDGCMITACLSLYKTTGDEKFLKFSRDFVDYFVKDGGEIYTFDANEHNLDNINQGKNLFSLVDLTGEQRCHQHHPRPAGHPAPHQGWQFLAQSHLPVAGLAGRHLYGAAILHGIRDPLQRHEGLPGQL